MADSTYRILRERLRRRPDLLFRGIYGLTNAWWHRLKFFILRKRVRMGRWCRLYGTIKVYGAGSVRIGKNAIIASDQGWQTVFNCISPSARITIGNNVGINGCTLACQQSITLDDYSMMAVGVYVTDTQAHSLRSDRRTNLDAPIVVQPVHLRRNVWVSVHAAILHGVTVGENSIVGAGAVVTKSIPANSFAAGVPAEVLRPLTSDPDERDGLA